MSGRYYEVTVFHIFPFGTGYVRAYPDGTQSHPPLPRKDWTREAMRNKACCTCHTTREDAMSALSSTGGGMWRMLGARA